MSHAWRLVSALLLAFAHDLHAVVVADPPALDFGGQVVTQPSPPRSVTLTNTGGSNTGVSLVGVSPRWSVTHDCAVLVPGASCTAQVVFTPATVGAVNGVATFTGSQNQVSVALQGAGELSLVSHYYRSILRREPDAPGKAFWESEKARILGLQADANEVWYAMAMAFFGSPEYASFNRDAGGFVTDLYRTFFNRAPDGGGLAFWVGQIAGGMPREVALAAFMFSPEFTGFTAAIFGGGGSRPEVDTVVDFYRGLLSRLPDTAGFDHWTDQFRVAQCLGAGHVYARVEQISSAYLTSPEYLGRARTDAQFVGDLYNAFLRRGGDLAGVQFWIGQLGTGAKTREQLRQDFIASAEFATRVAGVVGAGCTVATAAAASNASGQVTLQPGGLTLPIRLVDASTDAPVASAVASVAYRPDRPGLALLLVADGLGRYPIQVVILQSQAPGFVQEKAEAEVKVPVKKDGASQVLTAVVAALRTGFLDAIPAPQPDAKDFRSLFLNAAKEVTNSDKLLLPPPLQGVLPNVEFEGPIPIDEYLSRLNAKLTDDQASGAISWYATTFAEAAGGAVPGLFPLSAGLLGSMVQEMLPTVMSQITASSYQRAGATAVILHKIRFGGMSVVIPQPIYGAPPTPVLPPTPNASCQALNTSGGPLSGGSLELISKDTLGVGIRAVLDTNGRANIPVPLGSYEMRVDATGFAPSKRAVTATPAGVDCDATLPPLGDACCACNFDVSCQIFGAGGCWYCRQSTYDSSATCRAPGLAAPGACACDPGLYQTCS